MVPSSKRRTVCCRYKHTKNDVLQSNTKSIRSMTGSEQSSASLQSVSLSVRPLALPFKSTAPPIHVVAPLVQSLASPGRVFETSRCIPQLPDSDQSKATLAESAPLALTRQPPKYTPPQPKCNYCNTQFPEDKYSEHMITNHSELVFFCEECNRFVSRNVLVVHMSLHAYGYIPKKELNEKNKNDQDIDPVQNANEITALEEPVPDAPPNNDNEDSKKTDKQNEFSDHSDVDNDFDPIPESVFEAIEDSQDIQASHATEMESASDDSNTSDTNVEKISKKKCQLMSRACPICSRKFTAASSYFYHMKFTHKRVKEHQCEVCSKKFATRGSLTAHAATHTDERHFQCKECPKNFRSRASLYIHQQIHNGIKKFPCTECDMSFRWKTHLARHMKRHDAKKAHLCSTCGRGFSVHCDLLRHMRTHSAGQFTCEKCFQVFAQLRYLKAHMSKKHLEEGDS